MEFINQFNPFYLFCAVFGSFFVVVQFLMLVFTGIGGDSDGGNFDSGDGSFNGADGEINAGNTSYGSDVNDVGAHSVGHGSVFGFLKFLSLKTCTSGLAFFGLAGLACEAGELGPGATFGISALCGFSGILLVYFMFKLLYSLRYSGSIQEGSQLGCKGMVHVRIPPKRTGSGKIIVTQQERSMEYEAISDYDDILTSGTPIVIAEILSTSLVRVEKV